MTKIPSFGLCRRQLQWWAAVLASGKYQWQSKVAEEYGDAWKFLATQATISFRVSWTTMGAPQTTRQEHQRANKKKRRRRLFGHVHEKKKKYNCLYKQVQRRIPISLSLANALPPPSPGRACPEFFSVYPELHVIRCSLNFDNRNMSEKPCQLPDCKLPLASLKSWSFNIFFMLEKPRGLWSLTAWNLGVAKM